MSNHDRFAICDSCPGSMWGAKSICRVHQRSIGEIEACHEWDLIEKGVKAPRSSSAKTVHMEQVEEDLKDYPWMIREIIRLRGSRIGESQRSIRLKQLEAKVAKIDNAAESVTDNRLRTILDCIREGQRMNRIAQHMGISRQRLHELKIELIRLLAEGCLYESDRYRKTN